MFSVTGAKIINEGPNRSIMTSSGKHLLINKSYPFNSFTAKQSCVVDYDDREFILCKGGLTAVMEDDLPEDIEELSKKYERLGFRILTILGDEREPTYDRDLDEVGLEFLGFALFTDKIREDTQDVVGELLSSNIGINICTGDSLDATISVASEINICTRENIQIIDEDNYQILLSDSKGLFAIEGDSLDELKLDSFLPEIIKRTVIFGRCDPKQKQMVVNLLKDMNKNILYFGDGDNDLAAMADANVSLSLTKDTRMVVSSFISSEIKSVTNILKIGRTSLASIYSCFNFCVSSTFVSCGAILSTIFTGTCYSDAINLYLDLFTFYLCPFILSINDVVSRIDSVSCHFNFDKATLFLGLESLFYSIIFFVISFYTRDSSIPQANDTTINPKGCNISIIFLGNFYLGIYSLAFNSKIGSIGLSIFNSRIPLLVLIISSYTFIILVLLYCFSISWFNSLFFNEKYSTSTTDKYGLFIMFISFFIIHLTRYCYSRFSKSYNKTFNKSI
ncbi:YBF7 [Hepatospora eriocheir]|uniref:YBF7 n=1 Tax=Hepatospora eriocheir TaxID=1081669 RepID=A0A1X0QFK2_9MICR|nr:YBF7 [Hepatospora eriocheir]